MNDNNTLILMLTIFLKGGNDFKNLRVALADNGKNNFIKLLNWLLDIRLFGQNNVTIHLFFTWIYKVYYLQDDI